MDNRFLGDRYYKIVEGEYHSASSVPTMAFLVHQELDKRQMKVLKSQKKLLKNSIFYLVRHEEIGFF